MEPTAKTDGSSKLALDTQSMMAVAIVALIVLVVIVATCKNDMQLVRDMGKNYIGPAFFMLAGFLWGSSASSRRKDDTIAAQAETIGEAK